MIEKKKVRVIQDETIEYEINVVKDKGGVSYELCRSNNVAWSNPGEVIMTAYDNFNGIIINEIQYDYDQFSNLLIMFNTIIKVDVSIMSKLIYIMTKED